MLWRSESQRKSQRVYIITICFAAESIKYIEAKLWVESISLPDKASRAQIHSATHKDGLC